ncbi:MAG: hypothetical protein ACRDPG_02050 [Nocardioidaceae bacterium]
MGNRSRQRDHNDHLADLVAQLPEWVWLSPHEQTEHFRRPLDLADPMTRDLLEWNHPTRVSDVQASSRRAEALDVPCARHKLTRKELDRIRLTWQNEGG